jgi:TPR repeat protein
MEFSGTNHTQLSISSRQSIAQFNYGSALENGDAITMNKSPAAHYYRLAADQDYPDGQFHYGLLLVSG